MVQELGKLAHGTVFTIASSTYITKPAILVVALADVELAEELDGYKRFTFKLPHRQTVRPPSKMLGGIFLALTVLFRV